MYQEYNIDTKKKGIKIMVIRERVLESVLAAKIYSNPNLAKEFGLEISQEDGYLANKNLDNRIDTQSATTSTEAYK